MSVLFLDTTYEISFALFTSQFEQVHFETIPGQKTSELLHTKLFHALEKQKMEAKDIDQVAYLAGPGFYTGLRVAYMVAQIFKNESAAAVSIYSYELPQLLEEKNYLWVTKAYRGEYFVYDSESKEELLLDKVSFMEKLSKHKNLWAHCPKSIEGLEIKQISYTSHSYQDKMALMAKRICEYAKEKEVYYFRPPEVEFKVSK